MAALVCVGAYLFPYFYLHGWWRFIPSTVIILGTGVLALGPDAKRLFGIEVSKRDLALSVALFVVALPASFFMLSEVVVAESLTVYRLLVPRAQVHQFFQVFNDEIVMRAALLTVAIRLFPHPKTVILGLSLLFAFGHQVFYGFDGTEISATALTSLFAFGVIANTLFVRFRHIGYGLALHYAWNFWRFNAAYYLNGQRLPEGVTFNYIEGNTWVAGASTLAMLVVLAAYVRWDRSRLHARDA
jgi:hypothetical protein